MASDFQALQRAFAEHLRDPQQAPAPAGIEDRRMAIYRRLFFNNIQGFLTQAFPVLRQITSDAQWTALARRFYARHRCHRPQFYQVAEEFVEFLQQDDDPQAPPYRAELAHYEWVELVLAIDATPLPVYQPCVQLDSPHRPVFSPWLQLLSYDWPVQQIGPQYQPQAAPAQPTCLLVFRGLDDQVNFLQLNLLSARLIELLLPAEYSLEVALRQLAEQAQLPLAQLQGFAAGFINDLHQRGAILGITPEA